MKKKCIVALIATENKINSLKGYSDGSLLFNYQKEYKTLNAEGKLTDHYHLYILSDDEIKEGDWYVVLPEDSVRQCKMEFHSCRDFKKIIATTDSSLGKSKKEYTDKHGLKVEETSYFPLPSISQLFINYYVSEYNKGNKIESVWVEYVEMAISGIVPVIKDDNTIIIHPIKDSWTREEVIMLIESAIEFAVLPSNEIRNFNKWIESNL